MKLFLVIITLLIAMPIVAVNDMQLEQTTKDMSEMRIILQHIARINEYFSSLGARNSSSRHGAVFGYLKQLGTSAAVRVLKQLIKNGDLPKHFLNIAQAYS